MAGAAALGLFREHLTPSRSGTGHARHGGDRPSTTCSYVPGISQTSSTSSLTTCDLVSQCRFIPALSHHPRNQPGRPPGGVTKVIYHRYREDRARRTLAGTGEQVAKAEQAVAGRTPSNRTGSARSGFLTLE